MFLVMNRKPDGMEDQPAEEMMMMVKQVIWATGSSLNSMMLIHISYTLSIAYFIFVHLESHWCGHLHSFVAYTDIYAT